MLFTYDTETGITDYFESIEDVARFWGVRNEIVKYCLRTGIVFMSYIIDEVIE